MMLFTEKTWFLWWMFAVVIILRWFHVASVDIDAEAENLPIAASKDEAQGVRNQIASRA